ncbi:MAG: septum formation initiator family protein [Candidatus Symbiobacter sp.]|nr:septum formation initiator family protein [Candidatus Symbiobacter sp.]
MIDLAPETVRPTLRKVTRGGLAMIIFCALAIFYLSYNLVVGDRGILAWLRLRGEIDKAQLTLQLLKTEKLNIEKKVNALHPENLDPDMLEERVRAVLGLGRPQETVILLRRNESHPPIIDNSKAIHINNK